ncbi:hypothetical protein BGP75_09725 [Motiliproteus sp. MSK22-1]|nr:hypothetical protein BGP75_09725 [Motiliproteus sp. MSK22-1]
MPLILRICSYIDWINVSIGNSVAWLTIGMVVIQFMVVLLRYVFGFGSVFLQESIIYLHASVFLCGVGYTLSKDAHVRVDAFYHRFRQRTKDQINMLGSLIFIGSFVGVLSVYSWPYVWASWEVLEGSRETTGIPAVFLLKTLMLFYITLLALQGLSLFLKSFHRLYLEPRS